MPINEFLTSLSQLFDLLMNNPAALSVALLRHGGTGISGLAFLLKGILHARSRESKAFHRTILLIKVPKERKGEKVENAETDRIDQIRQEVAVAETLFSAVAGLRREKGFGAWLRGRNDHSAFEIVAKEGKISFPTWPCRIKSEILSASKSTLNILTPKLPRSRIIIFFSPSAISWALIFGLKTGRLFRLKLTKPWIATRCWPF